MMKFLPVAVVLAVAASSASAQPAPDSGAPGTPPADAPKSEPKAEPRRNVAQHNLDKAGLAIAGYDPVAYFPEGGGKPAKGKPTITHAHRGATYRFATEANRDAFLKDPSKYEPAHGGWCSYAMADGKKVEVDPTSFRVKGGRLFLFYKDFFNDTRATWLKQEATLEPKADAAWLKTSGEEPRKEEKKAG